MMFRFVMALAPAMPLASNSIPLIIDTDMGGGGCQDVDDVGTLCMAHALADNGEAELLAVVVDTSPEHCVGVVSVLNHYYGRDDVLIGAYKGADLSPSAPFLSYVSDLVEHWPSRAKSSAEVRDGVDVYREALAGQDDHSVVISSVGLLTNLAALLKSEPDRHSPLSGYELFAQKVKRLAVMGGVYGNHTVVLPRARCNNFCGCYDYADPVAAPAAEAAASYVISHLPPQVQVVYSGMELGRQVKTGAVLETCVPTGNPCRQAYLDYKDALPDSWTPQGRSSWDPLATLAAVRGPSAVGCSVCSDCDGVNTVDPATGQNTWLSGAPSNQTYLLLQNASFAEAALDELYCQPPRLESRYV